MRRLGVFLVFVFGLRIAGLTAQSADAIVPHPDDVRWWVSGQANLIFQWHGRFSSPYEGEHSLLSASDHAFSRVLTLYLGFAPRPGTELLFDVESASGRGIGDVLGLAGFTDLDEIGRASCRERV